MAWLVQGFRIDHSEDMTSSEHDREMNRFPLKKFGKSYENGSHPEGWGGANTRFENMVIRLLLILPENKRDISEFFLLEN